MPDTCTLTAFTQMNSSAEISRLFPADRDEPEHLELAGGEAPVPA
jgi:hypothetical protein